MKPITIKFALLPEQNIAFREKDIEFKLINESSREKRLIEIVIK